MRAANPFPPPLTHPAGYVSACARTPASEILKIRDREVGTPRKYRIRKVEEEGKGRNILRSAKRRDIRRARGKTGEMSLRCAKERQESVAGHVNRQSRILSFINDSPTIP